MIHRPRVLAIGSIASIVSIASVTSSAAAADPKATCVAAHGDAQTLRRSGKLRAAREKLAVCAMPSCPPLVTNDCAQWLIAVTAEQPTIAVRARDARGEPTVAVRVLVDGEVVSERLDGVPIAVDPGEHEFRFELGDGSTTTRRFVAAEGQKNELVEVDFIPPAKLPVAAVAPPPPTPGPPVAGYVAGGIAAAALGVFSAFAISGLSRESELDSTCAPGCSRQDIDDLKRRYAIADVALAVAAVSAGVAVWLFVDHARKSSPRSARLAISF